MDPITQMAVMCDLCTNQGSIDPQCVRACVVDALVLKGVE
jgi:Fe-S-cluster-containing hydrogenase component 2